MGRPQHPQCLDFLFRKWRANKKIGTEKKDNVQKRVMKINLSFKLFYSLKPDLYTKWMPGHLDIRSHYDKIKTNEIKSVEKDDSSTVVGCRRKVCKHYTCNDLFKIILPLSPCPSPLSSTHIYSLWQKHFPAFYLSAISVLDTVGLLVSVAFFISSSVSYLSSLLTFRMTSRCHVTGRVFTSGMLVSQLASTNWGETWTALLESENKTERK